MAWLGKVRFGNNVSMGGSVRVAMLQEVAGEIRLEARLAAYCRSRRAA